MLFLRFLKLIKFIKFDLIILLKNIKLYFKIITKNGKIINMKFSKGARVLSAKINNLRNLRKKDFEIIKELSLLGAYIKSRVFKGISEEEEEALFNLISRCGDEIIDETGNSEYDMNVDNVLLAEYNELIFWEVLAKKLAARDTLEELGEKINLDNIDIYKNLKEENERKYLKIFKVPKTPKIREKEIIFDDSLLPY